MSMLLTYPTTQTWLDERLFGWSRSALSGTISSRQGKHHNTEGGHSTATSGDSSPDLSDEEDDDYDMGISGRAGLRVLTRSSSYADLRMRNTPATNVNGAGEDEVAA